MAARQRSGRDARPACRRWRVTPRRGNAANAVVELLRRDFPPRRLRILRTCLAAKTEIETIDATAAARKFLACVVRTGQMFGVSRIVDILRGSRSAETLRRRHDRLPEYGTGQEHRRGRVAAPGRRIHPARASAARHGARQFATDPQGPGNARWRRGARASSHPAGRRGPHGRASPRPNALFDRLRGLRRELADAVDLPPYVMFSDRSPPRWRPTSPNPRRASLAIDGVGRHKLAQYGERFLAVIRAYCAKHGSVERPKTAAPAGSAREPIVPKSRTEEVGRLFAAGHTVAEMGALFGVTRGTVVQHLGRCVWSGQRFAPERIRELSALPPEDQARVLAAFAEHGTERLKPVFEALEETIPYDELHVMRMVSLCLESVTSAGHSTQH